jgi:hypothetical protein
VGHFASKNGNSAVATGPRTPEGKACVALNGKTLQKGPKSVREAKAERAFLRGLIRTMQETRRDLLDA